MASGKSGILGDQWAVRVPDGSPPAADRPALEHLGKCRTVALALGHFAPGGGGVACDDFRPADRLLPDDWSDGPAPFGYGPAISPVSCRCVPYRTDGGGICGPDPVPLSGGFAASLAAGGPVQPAAAGAVGNGRDNFPGYRRRCPGRMLHPVTGVAAEVWDQAAF